MTIENYFKKVSINDNMTQELIKFFFLRQTQWGSPTYNYCSEDNNGKWKNMQSVDNISDADFLVVYNMPQMMPSFPPDKTFCFTGEPNEFDFMRYWWNWVKGYQHYDRPMNHWHSLITYREFKQMDFPEKTKDLCWVTTSHGDKNTPEGIQITEGQRLRMQFLKKFLVKHPNKMYLYGRNLGDYISMQDFRYCGGELTDLWDGIRDYRYSIAFETSWQSGYFCKLIDPILAGCMPIYWGCPDLENFLPKNSFIRVDLRKDLDSICDEVMEIVKSDYREQNLDELEAAKELLLDKWNLWNVIYEEINKI